MVDGRLMSDRRPMVAVAGPPANTLQRTFADYPKPDTKKPG
jgi:hypothetical protein